MKTYCINSKHFTQDFNLLIVEDSEVDMEHWIYFLSKNESFNANIIQAFSAEEALRIIGNTRIHGALIDYRLPEMSGLQLLIEMTGRISKSENDSFPIIMISGDGSEEVATQAMKFGASDYIVKNNINAESILRVLENALDKHYLNQRIKEKQTELEFFARRIAHDLNAPLNRARVYLDMAINESSSESSSPPESSLELIKDDLEYMTKFIRDLHGYSSFASRSEELLDQVDLNQILQRCLKNLELQIKEKKALVKVDTLGVIKGCETSLVQLFQNLIQNSLKYNESDVPRIHITSDDKEDACIIKIQDNGIGIDPKYLKEIFRPLYRLNKKDHYKGTGLGLSTCQEIASQHEGLISAHSDGNNGSIFQVKFNRIH